ncbi:ligase-associated DNA damage response endonuclease PdeM [Sphingorhabdus sp. EL138]|uniref:ligase-associated DNA damage response endonuclease PdeM n=1 Tax=Sphingorhabdus sp. EL138 TaxID=2073156 RepID=UPI0025F19503|nr:ligase-associated DNA damage response endonuclease PdeM [Sphingorhabdus sp. EL138]
MAQSFEFGGQTFEITGQAALYWRAQDALLVSDLHLEKASAFALYGQMLPPYDSVSTLEEIATLCRTYRPAKIISLGDNFHDDDGEHRLAEGAAALLVDLACNTEWIWVTGNHDRAVSGMWGGKAFDALTLSGITLRHEAQAGDPNPEISGHFHPKFRQVLRGRMVKRRCFVKTPRKLIMPAFGALTGGLDVQDVAISKACDLKYGEGVEALVATQSGFARFALASPP